MNDQKDISSLTKKKVFAETGSRCAFCGHADVASLQIHHIGGKAIPNPHAFENLICVCGNCHSKITAGEISEADVWLRKRMLQFGGMHQPPGGSTVNADGAVNSGIIANHVVIKGGSARCRIVSHPLGTIGADADQHAYVQYLVRRYHEFREADASYGRVGRFNYGVLHKNIETQFNCKTFFIRSERFTDLVAYLQGRIDNTIQGKRSRSRGIPSYSAFDRYKAEQRAGGSHAVRTAAKFGLHTEGRSGQKSVLTPT